LNQGGGLAIQQGGEEKKGNTGKKVQGDGKRKNQALLKEGRTRCKRTPSQFLLLRGGKGTRPREVQSEHERNKKKKKKTRLKEGRSARDGRGDRVHLGKKRSVSQKGLFYLGPKGKAQGEGREGGGGGWEGLSTANVVMEKN